MEAIWATPQQFLLLLLSHASVFLCVVFQPMLGRVVVCSKPSPKPSPPLITHPSFDDHVSSAVLLEHTKTQPETMSENDRLFSSFTRGLFIPG